MLYNSCKIYLMNTLRLREDCLASCHWIHSHTKICFFSLSQCIEHVYKTNFSSSFRFF
jgi:hypothetical protein